ncbi:hypothetical protein K0M31_013387 [Melipona bicolor]|uniref:EGF-like domain-containing protein n=1 Tax=Melipona bicolor TaxID=60889 RepID=A0AA40FJ99_9HYME|nr:hypothetical protein K0M31_013387 [Melipona bicolor]
METEPSTSPVMAYRNFCVEHDPDGSPCEHDGICVNTPGSFACNCAQGFTGPRCETNVNECESHPCQNDGSCLDDPGTFRCVCMPAARLPKAGAARNVSAAANTANEQIAPSDSRDRPSIERPIEILPVDNRPCNRQGIGQTPPSVCTMAQDEGWTTGCSAIRPVREIWAESMF